jgi:hypothetical protein
VHDLVVAHEPVGQLLETDRVDAPLLKQEPPDAVVVDVAAGLPRPNEGVLEERAQQVGAALAVARAAAEDADDLLVEAQ